ncbi:acetylglutamate kinase [Trueperella sp. LYQ141]|uniref:acetylglutamate kinase n=1 Tax=Trueperella sp. LYQ141 TaxID=3391058 RepID=UPI003983D4A7
MNNSLIQRLDGAQEKAATLIEALPWIREFSGSRIVIKYGGNAMTSEELKRAFAKDVMFLHYVGLQPIVVHGGGPHINEMLRQLGIEPQFRGGLRVTDRATMDIVRMVLTGQVQRELVTLLNLDGSHAVGISGEDAGLLTAHKHYATIAGEPVDIGYVGDIAQVNTAAIEHLLAVRRIPVISSIALNADAPEDVLNVNADSVAGALAVALGAHKLVILTDVEGLYRSWPDTDTLISEIHPDELRTLIPHLDAGMKPKMMAALAAVDGGVPKAHIIDGRLSHSMLLEIFTDAGIGTQVTHNVAVEHADNKQPATAAATAGVGGSDGSEESSAQPEKRA